MDIPLGNLEVAGSLHFLLLRWNFASTAHHIDVDIGAVGITLGE